MALHPDYYEAAYLKKLAADKWGEKWASPMLKGYWKYTARGSVWKYDKRLPDRYAYFGDSVAGEITVDTILNP